jgi:hypothetical protein
MKKFIPTTLLLPKATVSFFFTLLAVAFSLNGFTQAAFTTTWPLTADQSYTNSGAGAATVTAVNQALTGTLFIPSSNSYYGTTSGTAGDGQRISPRQNDGNDGGWVNDGAEVSGRYMEFAVNPNAGYSMNVSNISFYVGNRSRSELRGNVYYSVGASWGTGTLLQAGAKAGSNNTWQFYSIPTNIAVPDGQKIFVRIYPFNTGSATTGKYFCTKQVVITGTTTLPNFTNITFTTPATCLTDRLTISWNGPAGYNNGTETIIAFLKPTNAVAVGAPPYGTLASYTANTVYGSGTSYHAGEATARCIYKGTGTNAAGDHSGLLITGLTQNTTYHLLIFYVSNATNAYSVGAAGNGTTLKTLATPSLGPGVITRTLQGTNSLPVSWAASGATNQDGYLVRVDDATTLAALANGTDPAPETDLTAVNPANAKTTAITYNANSFTGLAPGTMYTYRVQSYYNSGSCIRYNATSRTISVATLPNPVTNQSFGIVGTTGTITWTTAAGYNANNLTLVFLKQGSAVNTSTYANNPSYGGGINTPNTYYTASTDWSVKGTNYRSAVNNYDPNAYCVYKGTGNSVTVTNLTAGFTYHIIILNVVTIGNSTVGTVAPNIENGITYSTSAPATANAAAGINYVWQGGAAGDWQDPNNWNPTRTTPATTDNLTFNSGVATPINFPAVGQTIASLTVTTNSTVTIGGGALTISSNNGLLNNDLIIDAGSTLNLTSSLILSANTLASIAGTCSANSGGTYNTSAAGAITTVTGILRNAGTVTTIANNIVVNNNGTYDHALDGGTIPTNVWNAGSICRVSGIVSNTTINGHSQVFSRFAYDCASQGAINFVLGSNTSIMEATDSFIVYRTGTGTVQLTSSSGQRDFSVGNYIQYGGTVAITYSTGAGGQRSLAVNNTFYASDSLGNTRFLIISDPANSSAFGRLFVGGNMVMRQVSTNTVSLEKTGNLTNSGELWFNGGIDQHAQFSTITGEVDFYTAQAAAGYSVTLGSDATAYRFVLTQGIFRIGSNTLRINNAVSYPSPGTGTIAGSATSNLTMAMAGTAGTLNFTTGSQVLKDFTQLAGNTVTLGTQLAITAGAAAGRDSLGNGAVLNTNDNLILRSDANGTARIAQVVGTATVNGKVRVERYLPMALTSAARRWRLMGAPFKSSNAPTINAGWQAGGSTVTQASPVDLRPGYGTQITKSTTWAADGYDIGSTNNPSLYSYNNGLNAWQAPANTNATPLHNNTVYMLFARGDRSIPVSGTTVAAAPTTLDPLGEVHIGNVVVTGIGATGFYTVANPYASQISLDNVDFNGTLGINQVIYLWDPKTLGSFNVGNFITCSGNGNGTYTYTANSSGFDPAKAVIESSGAFMVAGIGGNITFHESDKTIGSSTVGIASRPVSSAGNNAFGTIRSLHTDLYVMRNGEPVLADGVANLYNRNYRNTIDAFDAPKFNSFNTKEKISILRGNNALAIERRKAVVRTDTIFLQLSKLNVSAYQFGFRPSAFDGHYSAVLVDKYLHTVTPVSLLEPTTVSFSITADAASAAEDRFYIVFSKNAPPKNVHLQASLQQPGIALNWNNTDEEDTDDHVIERSADGDRFAVIGSIAAQVTARGTLEYSWLDENLLPGDYYYRIRYTDEAGATAYSNTVKVVKGTKTGVPTVMPNPVQNGEVNLYMGHLPEGNYTVRITNGAGQLLQVSNFLHSSTHSIQKIQLKNQADKGICRLEIFSGTKKVYTLSLLLQ